MEQTKENSGALQDPVCGMAVGPDSPHRTVHEGQEYVFCSPHCLAKFREKPETYLR